MGIKATAGFGAGSCSPPDYAKTAAYVLQTGLRGASVWTFLFDNSTMKSSWWREGCGAGYAGLCDKLSCGSASPPGPARLV